MSRSIGDKGGYFYDAKAEKASWGELEQARGDWVFHDACDWYERLLSGKHHLSDLKVGAVKLYAGALLRRATLQTPQAYVKCSTVRCSK